MNKSKKFISAVGCLLMLTPVALAHPGKTDANGGHWNTETGEYHYHHGYPAHLHNNGVCPYGFDVKYDPQYAEEEPEPSPAIAAAQAAVAASGEAELAENDYGPEAEEDFESKREAYASGYEDGKEGGYDQAHDDGYEEGYEEGYQQGESDGYDPAYEDGYNEGYRDGLDADRSAPNNDIIDRSELSAPRTVTNPDKKYDVEQWLYLYIPLIVVGILALFCLIEFIRDKRKNR